MAGGSEARIISTEIGSGISRVVTGFVIPPQDQMQDCTLNRPASSMSSLNISLAFPSIASSSPRDPATDWREMGGA